MGSDSDSDEDDKRVVRSAKDRRGEELRTICDEMRVRSHSGSRKCCTGSHDLFRYCCHAESTFRCCERRLSAGACINRAPWSCLTVLGCRFSLQNKMHINDWSSIQTLFDRLNKQLEKIMKTAPGLGVPRVYARILAELEDFLVKSLADKAARKKVRIVAA